jgi:hypothetical protein
MQDIDIKINGGNTVVLPIMAKICKVLNILTEFNCKGDVSPRELELWFYKTVQGSRHWTIQICWCIDTFFLEAHRETKKVGTVEFNFCPNGITGGADEEDFRWQLNNLEKQLIKWGVQ